MACDVVEVAREKRMRGEANEAEGDRGKGEASQ
jgi:hypothetical protein